MTTRAPLVFLDTETTGLHPDRQAWEIAMIRREPDGLTDQTSFYVEVDLDRADPAGLAIGRFYQRHPMGIRLSSNLSRRLGGDDDDPPDIYRDDVVAKVDAAARVAQWTHGAHIVGAVPNFDTEVLAQLLREYWLIPAWHYHLIDVENLAVGYLAQRFGWEQLAPPWDSDEISKALGIEVPVEERHTALGDARWAMTLYDAVMGGAS